MDIETIQAISNAADSLTTLGLALVFIYYLVKQIARRDDLFFDDWKRQRERETDE